MDERPRSGEDDFLFISLVAVSFRLRSLHYSHNSFSFRALPRSLSEPDVCEELLLFNNIFYRQKPFLEMVT